MCFCICEKKRRNIIRQILQKQHVYFFLANLNYFSLNSYFQGFSTDIHFPVWLRNRLLSAGLEPVLSQTEKACTASNYRQFLRISKLKILRLKPGLSAAKGRSMAKNRF